MEGSYPVVCLIAHVDHGKTTLADGLLAAGGYIAKKAAGQLRFMDTRDDEQKRLITIKSSSIFLNLPRVKFTLTDTPGHVDYSYEVVVGTAAADAAILLIDSTEGVQAQTRCTLRQALSLSLKLVLIINKIDKLFTSLQYDAHRAFQQIRQTIENANAAVHAAEQYNLGEDAELADEYFSLEKNVIIGSALDGWLLDASKAIETVLPKLPDNKKSNVKTWLFEKNGFETALISSIEKQYANHDVSKLAAKWPMADTLSTWLENNLTFPDNQSLDNNENSEVSVKFIRKVLIDHEKGIIIGDTLKSQEKVSGVATVGKVIRGCLTENSELFFGGRHLSRGKIFQINGMSLAPFKKIYPGQLFIVELPAEIHIQCALNKPFSIPDNFPNAERARSNYYNRTISLHNYPISSENSDLINSILNHPYVYNTLSTKPNAGDIKEKWDWRSNLPESLVALTTRIHLYIPPIYVESIVIENWIETANHISNLETSLNEPVEGLILQRIFKQLIIQNKDIKPLDTVKDLHYLMADPNVPSHGLLGVCITGWKPIYNSEPGNIWVTSSMSALERLKVGLELIQCVDPCVDWEMSSRGELILLVTGEEHLNRVLTDLKSITAPSIEFNVGNTIICLRETIVQGSGIYPSTLEELRELEGDLPMGNLGTNIDTAEFSVLLSNLEPANLVIKHDAEQNLNNDLNKTDPIHNNTESNTIDILKNDMIVVTNDIDIKCNKVQEDTNEKLNLINSPSKAETSNIAIPEGYIPYNHTRVWNRISCEVSSKSAILSRGSARIVVRALSMPDSIYLALTTSSILPDSIQIQASHIREDKCSALVIMPEVPPEVVQYISMGYQIIAESGPICGEPIHRVIFLVLSATKSDIPNLISSSRDAFAASLLINPNLLALEHRLSLQIRTTNAKSAKAFLDSKAAEIRDLEQRGEELVMKADIPQRYSMGISEELRKGGSYLESMTPAGWFPCSSHPFGWQPEEDDEEPVLPWLTLLQSVRTRKGLPVVVQAVLDGRKQRTMARCK